MSAHLAILQPTISELLASHPILLSVTAGLTPPTQMAAGCVVLACEATNEAVLVYSAPHVNPQEPIAVEYTARLRKAGYKVTGRKETLSDVDQIRESFKEGGTAGRSRSYSETARQKALHFLRYAEDIGASDLRLNVDAKYCHVRAKVLQRSVFIEELTAADGMDVCRAIYNGLAGQIDDTALDERKLQDAAIKRTTATELDIPPARIGSHGGPDDGLLMTLRILPRAGKANRKLSEMGLLPEQLELIMQASRRRDGGVLIAGPMNAGKSTLLIAMIEEVAKDGTVDVITIEDPIEYTTPYKNVAQLPKIDTWEHELTAIKRQSLDIAMPSEIRGAESALICAEMAQSGLGVWSTLHQDDMFGIPGQLVRWGVEKDLVYNTRLLNLIGHQRLVRTVCPGCAVSADSVQLDNPTRERFRRAIGNLQGVRFKGPGCIKCEHRKNPGEADLTSASEFVRPTRQLMSTLMKHGPFAARELWLAEGGISRLQHVLVHIRSGLVDPRTAESMLDIELDAEVMHVDAVA